MTGGGWAGKVSAGERWEVRDGSVGDVDAVVELERETPEAPHWRREVYAGIFAEEVGGVRRRLLVAERGGEVVGFAVGAMPGLGAEGAWGGAERVGELESVAVAAGVRRSGIGRALCGGVLGWCRGLGAGSVELEVRSGSTIAVAAYAALGFAVTGRRKVYYSGPTEDALLMRVELGGWEDGGG